MANIETSMSFTSTTQGGDKLQKAITDINPDAAGDKLVGFAQKLNALTTNTYTGATKIVKQELSATAKTEATLKFGSESNGTVSAAEIIAAGGKQTTANSNNTTGRVVLTYNDTAFPVTFARRTKTLLNSVQIYIGTLNETLRTSITNPESDNNYVNGDPEKHVSLTGTIKFYIEEDDTYTRSPELTLTINA